MNFSVGAFAFFRVFGRVGNHREGFKAGEGEVMQLESVRVREEDVIRFEVSMDEVMEVKMVHGLDQLREVGLNVGEGQRVLEFILEV